MSSRDDTPTWRKNKVRVQTSDDRALEANARRRAQPHGIPIQLPPDECDITSPHDLLERDPDHEVEAVVQRSRRNSDDPATFADVVKLAVALTKERSASRQREAETETVLQGPHKAHKATRRNLIATVIAAAASIGAAVKQWNDHASAGAGSGSGDAVRIELMQKSIDRLDSELREIRAVLGRRSELLELPPVSDQLASKGFMQ